MGEEGFTSRQKGDLYWRKRILYIKSASVRGGHHEGYLNRDTAEDTLVCYEKSETEAQPFLTGRELVICPPTAAGQWLFSDSVASLMRIRDMIRDTDTTEPKGDNNEFEDLAHKILIDGGKNLYSLIDRMIEDYFIASGIDHDKKPVSDRDKIRAARDSFNKNRDLYEGEIHKVILANGTRFIKILAKQMGIEEHMPVPYEITDRAFLKMKEAENYPIYEEELNKLYEVMISARREAMESLIAKDKLIGDIYSKYFNKGGDSMRRKILMTSFFEYRHEIDKNAQKLMAVREAGYYYARYLLYDEAVDPLTFDRIKTFFKKQPVTLEDDMLIETIPDFSIPEENRGCDEGDYDYDAISTAIDEIMDYMDLYPGKFYAQSLLSVVTDNDSLGAFAHKVRTLDRAIDRFTLSGGASELDKDMFLKVFEGWVMADALYRVTSYIMYFCFEHRYDTVSEATEALSAILPDMNYAACERKSRGVIRKIILERSGFNA